MKTFYLIRGVAGSGKTTLAKSIADQYRDREIAFCEADHWMINRDGKYEFNPKMLKYAHEACFNKFKSAILEGIEIAIQSNTNIKRWEYQKYLDLAREYEYKIVEIIVKSDDFKSVHDVPPEKIEKMKREFEY